MAFLIWLFLFNSRKSIVKLFSHSEQTHFSKYISKTIYNKKTFVCWFYIVIIALLLNENIKIMSKLYILNENTKEQKVLKCNKIIYITSAIFN